MKMYFSQSTLSSAMATFTSALLDQLSITALAASVSLGLLLVLLIAKLQSRSSKRPSPPSVPGFPLVGNLLQLKDKKPHQTFTKWAEIYGPIYKIKTGASTVVVVNSTDVVKEVMVTRHSSISTRKLSNALNILTSGKCMVAMSDYNEFHKMVKRYILTSLLGANAQKRLHYQRDKMIENVMSQLHSHVKDNPLQAVNLRHIFESELFGLSMKQGIGKDVELPVYVEELGTSLSREEIFEILVIDPMKGAIEVDWRDFFPYLRWIPNSIETKIQQMNFRRKAVMKALIKEQKKRISSGEKLNSYLDFMLTEAKDLTEDQVTMLAWEAIIESSDTTLVVTEWAMYELAKNPNIQDRLYREIQSVCGSDKVTEEHLSQLPYLNAVFHETLRKHSPVPLVPSRYAHEDTELGGYHIPAGTELAINIYGCNMDKKQWGEDADVWKPERFLDSKYDQMDLYKTMAFGAGKRVCAGSLQAMTITCTSIARFVQDFEWRLTEGEAEDVDIVGLTTHKLRPLHAIIEPRA